MKTLLKAALAALLCMGTYSQAQIDTLLITPTLSDASTNTQASDELEGPKEFPAPERHSIWISSRAYQSEDLPAYLAGAKQILAELKREINVVEDWAGPEVPKFMQTRLLALRHQHEHATLLLKSLTAEAVKHRLSGPRHAFDRAVNLLERTIDEATFEVDRVQEISNPGPIGSDT